MEVVSNQVRGITADLGTKVSVLTKKEGASLAFCIMVVISILITGCAGMAYLRAPLEEATGLPVVEPCQAAAAMALGQIALNLSHRVKDPRYAR